MRQIYKPDNTAADLVFGLYICEMEEMEGEHSIDEMNKPDFSLLVGVAVDWCCPWY